MAKMQTGRPESFQTHIEVIDNRMEVDSAQKTSGRNFINQLERPVDGTLKQEETWRGFATSLSPGAAEFFRRPQGPFLSPHDANGDSARPERVEPSRPSAHVIRVAEWASPLELLPDKMS